MKTWWYGPETLPHGDGRPVKPGMTLRVDGDVVLCENGLHQSVKPLDALQYGSGHFWRCTPGGTIVHGDDKLASSERTHLWRVADTDAVLRHFARLCALDVVHLWDAPDVVVRYLRTGDESIRDAARAAARDAAWAAARDAAWAAAGAAARAAAWDAAWAAAGGAAWAAARGAAGAAAWAAAGAAAGAAAWAAAWDAARDAQNKRLHRMLMQAERVTP